MNLYTVVTNDDLELPVKSDMRVGEAAEFLGTTKNNVRRMICRPPKKAKYKVIVTGKVKADRAVYQRNYDMTHDRSEYFRQRYRRMKGNKP